MRRGNHIPAWYLLLVAISQACYATGKNHERAVLKQLLSELDLQGLLIQADALHTFLTSLHTAPEGMLKLAGNPWTIEGLHWIRDTQLHEDAHRYPGNGAGVMGSLRTAAL